LSLRSEDDIGATLKAKVLELRADVELRAEVVRAKPVHAKLGPAYKRDAKEISSRLAELKEGEFDIREDGLHIVLPDGRPIVLGSDYVQLEKRLSTERGGVDQLSVAGFSVLLYR
jgi:valyl-tRNA synthetase